MGDVFVWTGAAGDFDTADATNWDNLTTGQNPAPNPPAAADSATIAGATVGGDLSVQSLTLDGTTTAVTVSLILASPTTDLAGASVTTLGAVNVESQSTLGAGTLVVSGTSALAVQPGGTLSLLAGSGTTDVAIVGNVAGEQAALTISGAGATMNDLYTSVFLGGAGNAQASVSDSASMQIGAAGSTLGEAALVVGQIAGSTGTLNVTGSGSSLQVQGTTTLGQGGTGTLTIGTGASATLGDGANSLVMGAATGGLGQMTVSDVGTTLTLNGLFDIGQTSSGTLTIENGAAAVFEGTALANSTDYVGTIGDGAGATGAVTVSGAGTSLTITGRLGIAEQGSGTLTVQQGATVTENGTTVAGYYEIFVADAGGTSPSTGTLVVDGGTLKNGGSIGVGGAGNGKLLISAGGQVTAASPAAGSLAVGVGYSTGGQGTVSIDGTGSGLTAAGAVSIGQYGSGTLSITNGGQMLVSSGAASAEILLGQNYGTSGTATVSGKGSLLSDSGFLLVANIGNGVLDAESGATVQVGGSVLIGARAGATGSISLSGGAVLDVATNLTVGSAGSGSLAINGASATVAGDSFIAGGVTLGAGTLASAATIVEAGGSIAGNGTVKDTATLLNQGTISVGSGALAFLGGALNYGAMSTTGGKLVIFQQITGTGTLGIGGGGTLDLVAGAQAGQSVGFSGAGTLDLGKPGFFAAPISGFAAQDTLDLANTAATSLSYSNGVLSVLGGAKVLDRLHFTGTYTTADFSLASDGHAGALIGFV